VNCEDYIWSWTVDGGGVFTHSHGAENVIGIPDAALVGKPAKRLSHILACCKRSKWCDAIQYKEMELYCIAEMTFSENGGEHTGFRGVCARS